MPNDEQVQVGIPKDLYEQVEEHVKGTEFSSVSDYIIFILREVLSEEEKEVFSKEEEEKVKQRLRGLGYLD